jgi:lipoprotein-releasing system ATP-binding protein
MLQAKGIKKKYGSLEVLKGVDLEIRKGEIVSIVGASGAGKTTLLNILGTLDKADSGQIIINDTDISQLNDKQLAQFRNKQIGFIFQFHNLLAEFSALENVCIPAWIGGVVQGSRFKVQSSKSEATNSNIQSTVEDKAKELLSLLGLSHRFNHLPSELSGGEQQRVAVARALINSPAVVFADEPSGNLDSHNAEELNKLISDLRKQLDQTFVIITHNELLANRADRKLLMQDGLIVQG